MTIDKEIRFYTGDRADLRDVELGAKERGIEEDYGHHLAYKDELGNYHVCALQVEAGLVDAGFVVGDSDGKLTIGTDLTCNSINVNSTIAVVGTIDDDTFATATDTTWATSESIKAYVDSAVLAEDFWDKTSNVVHLKTATDQVHIGGTTSGSKVNITYETATTSAAIDILKLVAHSSGTAAAGFGGSIQWVMENAAGNDGTWGRINCILTDAGNGTEDSAFLFYTYKAGTGLREVVRIDSDGFVGIGVTNPDTKLEVFSAAATQLKLSYDGTYYSTLGTSATGMLNLVASGGFVGIGVTDPDTALEIYKAGTQLKLSYDAPHYTTLSSDPSGILQIYPSGSYISFNNNSTLFIDGTGKLLTNRIEDASGGTIDIEAIVEIGGVANYSKFESDGTLVFVGDATVWEDISIDLSPLQTGGTKPGFVTVASTNIRLLSFALNEDVDGSFEIPHAYKLSSNMTPHIHFLPTDAPSAGPDYVTFEMEYFIVNTDGTVSTSTTIDSGDVEIDTQWKVQRVDLPTISNSTLGGQVAFKIKRTGASTNQYGGECAVLTLGFHYEKDAVGSRQIGVK